MLPRLHYSKILYSISFLLTKPLCLELFVIQNVDYVSSYQPHAALHSSPAQVTGSQQKQQNQKFTATELK